MHNTYIIMYIQSMYIQKYGAIIIREFIVNLLLVSTFLYIVRISFIIVMVIITDIL